MLNTRITKLRAKMEKEAVDGTIITYLPNIYYLIGFTGSNGILLITHREAILFTDFRYKEQCVREIKGAETFIIKDSLLDEFAAHPLLKSLNKIGFEDTTIRYATYSTLKQKLTSKELVPFKNKVEELRKIKDPQEIEVIKKAAQIAHTVFNSIVPIAQPGIKEEDIAIELEYQFRKHGAEKASFDTIVASGPNAALPHARASNKRLQEGETVTFDFGVLYEHYASDTTRTIILGKNPKAREIYKIVQQAQEKAINSIKQGVQLKEIDAIARNIITEAGYGKYFGHSLGHGIGIEVHEEPKVSKKSEDIVQPGMVFTIEPGIYLPNWGGVRIEDMIVVTEKGIEIITN